MGMLNSQSYFLRNVRYAGEAAGGTFSATLVCGSQVVATVTGRLGETGEIEVEPVHPFYWEQFVGLATQRPCVGDAQLDDADEPAAVWLLEMADDWYHARRLQMTSSKHTTFRLVGDPPGTFRYVRGRPYSLEVEGELRLTYGRRLERVYRRGDGAGLAQAA
jgi:hypothetical protein